MVVPSHNPALPEVGQILAGKYRVDGLIGKGGMGAVFAARHGFLNQRVAVKLLANHLEGDPVAVARFMNEARAAALIRSEHVARVLDMGLLDDGRPFLVMELLHGCDLARLLAQRRELPSRLAVDYVVEAIEGLAHAHAVGIIHRDLKPSNLFLAERSDGTSVVKVLDFGIAKAIGAAAAKQATVTTQGLMGSPAYMSPEQVRSQKSIDARSDVWALGVILYELLSGSLPFRGDNVGEVLAAILEKSPSPIGASRPDLPAGLMAVVTRCLQRDPAKRYADVADLAEALAPFGSRQSPSIARIRKTMAALATSTQSAGSIGGTAAGVTIDPDLATQLVGERAHANAHAHQTGSSWTEAVRHSAKRGVAWGAVAAAIVASLGVGIVLAVQGETKGMTASGAPAIASAPAPASAPATAPASASASPSASASASAPAASTSAPVKSAPPRKPARPPAKSAPRPSYR